MKMKQIMNLQSVIEKAKDNQSVLDNVLTDATLAIQPATGPVEAAKRK